MAPASGVTQKSGTTTLSTIVLRSKETQVVIALLRSGSEIDLKVLYIIYIGIFFKRVHLYVSYIFFLTNFYMAAVAEVPKHDFSKQ